MKDRENKYCILIYNNNTCFLFLFMFQNYAVDTGFTTSDDFTETSVRVRNLSPRQLGVYVCRAQNKLGSAEKEINVVQQYEPDCVVGLCDRYTSRATKTAAATTVILPTLIAMTAALMFWKAKGLTSTKWKKFREEYGG